MAHKPPAILFLLDWQPRFWSTREEYYRQLSRRLVERGIKPILVVSELPDQATLQRLQQAGAHVAPCSYRASRLAYWTHIRRLKREFSLRLAHIRFFDYFTALHWLCCLSGIPAVIFTDANSGSWRGSSNSGLKAALVRARARLMCWPLDQLVAVSEFIGQRLQRLGLPPERIRVIYNGVDLTSFNPSPPDRAAVRKEMRAGDRTIVLLFAAIFLGWKRPETAMATCAELVRRGMDVQLWMIGSGPLQQQLEQQADGMGITAHVRWLGYQPNPQRWMAGADLLIHTAEGEAFGNVLVEAMGCGLPVIASRSGAAPELIIEGKTGRLVEPAPDETAALADAAIHLTHDPALYSAHSQEAILQARRFTTAISVERALALYQPYLDRL